MKNRKGERAPQLRRLAGVVGGVAATALCLSFAWSVVGGALRPSTPQLPDSIVIATSVPPAPLPPLTPPAPHRKRAIPTVTAKVVAPEARQSVTKSSSASKIAAVPSKKTISAATASTSALAIAASSLLQTESKSSRTRGQPGQN